MGNGNVEQEYLEDKKYIHKTLDKTASDVEKLHEKFETFKLDVVQKLAIIQTKMGLYSIIGSLVAGSIVSYIMNKLLG